VTLLSHDAVDDRERASALADEGSRLNEISSSTKAMIGMCRGFVAEKNGDQQEALTLYRESARIAREIDFDRTPGLLMNLGWLALRQGDLVEGRAQLSDAVTYATESGAQGFAVGAVAYLAVLAAEEGDLTRAARLRGAVETYRQTVGEIPLTEFTDGTFDSYLDEARALAGERRWTEDLQRGRTMSIAEAIEYALRPSHTGPFHVTASS
jgi:hypothetical protein